MEIWGCDESYTGRYLKRINGWLRRKREIVQRIFERSKRVWRYRKEKYEMKVKRRVLYSFARKLEKVQRRIQSTFKILQSL